MFYGTDQMATGEIVESNKEDPMSLHNSDHPGMNLITTSLTGNNYMTWSRSIKIALGAKTKVGFIDGKYKPPDETNPKYE